MVPGPGLLVISVLQQYWSSPGRLNAKRDGRANRSRARGGIRTPSILT